MPSSKIDFDKAASSWDDEPRRVKLANDVAQTIMREVKLSQGMEVLDYGCGYVVFHSVSVLENRAGLELSTEELIGKFWIF